MVGHPGRRPGLQNRNDGGTEMASGFGPWGSLELFRQGAFGTARPRGHLSGDFVAVAPAAPRNPQTPKPDPVPSAAVRSALISLTVNHGAGA